MMLSCRAGDGTAGRRLTCSDARIVYRLTELRPGLIPILRRASAHDRPRSASAGVPHRGPVSSFARRISVIARCLVRATSSSGSHRCKFRRCRFDMTCYVPQKGCDLACDSRSGDGLPFAPRHQPPIASAEPDLGPPGNITDLLRKMRLAVLVTTTDACRMAIGPCRFDQGLAGAAVTCLCDPALTSRLSG